MENITEAYLHHKLTFGNVVADGVEYKPQHYWISEDQTVWGCPCLVKPCIQKCCKEGETHVINEEIDEEYDELYRIANCTRHDGEPFNAKHSRIYDQKLQEVSVDENHFFVIKHDFTCEKFTINSEEEKSSFLMTDGRLYRKLVKLQPFYNYTEFCVDSSVDSLTVNFKVCISTQNPENMLENDTDWTYYLKAIGFVASTPFLGATFFVYALLPQLKNLHGKSLMCYCGSLTAAYACLPIATFFSDYLSTKMCTGMGFLGLFTILASFFWLNVMCFDIWWVFSGLMPLRGSQKDAEQFKFMMYSLYAWGTPLLLLLVALFIQYADGVPDAIVKPNIGVQACFLSDPSSRLMYLYLPLGVLVYLNMLMFLTTALRFKSHSKSVKKLQRGDSRRHCQTGKTCTDMQRFSLYFKLFLVMGVNWVLELLSFLFGEESSLLWLIPDLGNTLQGVVIFYMFVCKSCILRQVQARLCPSLKLFSQESTKSSQEARTVTTSTSVRFKVREGKEYRCTLGSNDTEESAT